MLGYKSDLRLRTDVNATQGVRVQAEIGSIDASYVPPACRTHTAQARACAMGLSYGLSSYPLPRLTEKSKVPSMELNNVSSDEKYVL